MNDPSCDINDVAKAGSDLVVLGCTIGATNFYDGFTQLQFGSIIANFVNEVIKDVNDGLISAWEGVQEIRAEYADLSNKVLFYAQNGIGVAAGVMQVEVGIAITGSSYGAGAPVGAFFVAHGVNNIYEGGMNIYNGPGAPAAQGPTRRAYQMFLDDDYKGDMAYGTIDLILSAGAMMRPVRRTDAVQLFRRDPLNYESAYQQTGKLALFFEALVDAITINAMLSKEKLEIENN
ncbi:DUF4225 domain-containing protein [Pseudomonas brassicacearum]|uniref:DUF4225 domain-containing protein n=1 Tax=Pseudomonas brassicacearum TaxID=930166 RepID=A0AAJ3KVF4_9PSED|nr:DUF4225 domain-containing protein [Pseudomonas brassicacearum]NUT81333.1 DUF4225 domain-containing protein [Pseudomonas brassicacearum]QGA50462.1 DUF4225 domain-containing protein [Pseudomonas brassicacearum]